MRVGENLTPKIIVNALLTVDGVMQAPGGPDELTGRLVTEGFADADDFLLGRKTGDIFANDWPRITDPDYAIAAAPNSRPRHVASRSLSHVGWSGMASRLMGRWDEDRVAPAGWAQSKHASLLTDANEGVHVGFENGLPSLTTSALVAIRG